MLLTSRKVSQILPPSCKRLGSGDVQFSDLQSMGGGGGGGGEGAVIQLPIVNGRG